MAEQRPDCEHCKDHPLNSMKIKQHCDRLDKMEEKYDSLEDLIRGKDGKPGLTTRFALMDQKLENFKWPLYIIASAAVLQIGKTLFSFGPAMEAAREVSKVLQ